MTKTINKHGLHWYCFGDEALMICDRMMRYLNPQASNQVTVEARRRKFRDSKKVVFKYDHNVLRANRIVVSTETQQLIHRHFSFTRKLTLWVKAQNL